MANDKTIALPLPLPSTPDPSRPGTDPARSPQGPAAQPGRLRPGWPLSVIFLAFPLWWMLGLGALIFMVMAVPMALYLWRRRERLVAPGGFGVWLLFLAWVMLGVVVLWADAPDTEPGGGVSRLLVFGWRMAWYLCCTIVLLYIANHDERELPTGRIGGLLGIMFIFTTVGGLVGSFLPGLQITSPFELLLPEGVASNPFVRDIVDPKTAEISTILGFEQSRPMAPFAYANTWGAAYAFLLPFFLITWVIRARGRKRLFGVLILMASLWPVVYSLNRGLWAALGLIVAFALMKIIIVGGAKYISRAIAVLAIGAVLVAFSPLPGMIMTRLDNPHSNNRRTELASQTIGTALAGSPLVGFGSTRDVQGNLQSIGGGSRPGCSACGSPPLGTQGHIWLLIFAHGTVGTLAFLVFFGIRFVRHWLDRSAYSLAGCCVLLSCALFLFFYDLVEVPLYTVMIAVALMWRAKRDAAAAPHGAAL
ncbi:hypothetical protein [Actinomadura sp. 9N407]|uniref:hypothetical protein n=1 Tax=Actinomadura sp. 9N407 TaxID=3375154 RepID=UPI0037B47114